MSEESQRLAAQIQAIFTRPLEELLPLRLDTHHPDSGIRRQAAMLMAANGEHVGWVYEDELAEFIRDAANAAWEARVRDRKVVPAHRSPDGLSQVARTCKAVFDNHPGPYRPVEVWERILEPRPSKSAVSNALMTLQIRGFITRDPDRRWRRGSVP